MPKIHIKQKFPCGYELDFDIESGFRNIDTENLILGVCPIHKDKCKK
jgi:hypothetical protein